jgi:hypothetical protein
VVPERGQAAHQEGFWAPLARPSVPGPARGSCRPVCPLGAVRGAECAGTARGGRPSLAPPVGQADSAACSPGSPPQPGSHGEDGTPGQEHSPKHRIVAGVSHQHCCSGSQATSGCPPVGTNEQSFGNGHSDHQVPGPHSRQVGPWPQPKGTAGHRRGDYHPQLSLAWLSRRPAQSRSGLPASLHEASSPATRALSATVGGSRPRAG